MPGDVKAPLRNLAGLGLFVVFDLLLVVIISFVFIFVIGRIGIGEFKDGKRQRLAKEIAFIAHPHARNSIVVDFHHAKRMSAGLQLLEYMTPIAF